MPHFLNFDSMRESAFHLHNLCLASRPYCELHKLSRSINSQSDHDWFSYAGMLKFYVSETIIQNATRTRIIQDTLKKFTHDEQEEWSLSDVNRDSIGGALVAHLASDKKPLSIREISNKIIHATDTKLEWLDLSDEVTYWTGCVKLFGCKDGVDWEVNFNAERYAYCLVRWLDMLDSKVDWRLVYEDDE